MKAKLVVVSALVALAGIIAIPQTALAAQPPGPGNQSYTLNMTWDATTHKLTGTESVTFTNNRSASISVAYFRLWPNSGEYGASCTKQ